MLYVKKGSESCNHSFTLVARTISGTSKQMIMQCKKCEAVSTTANDKWYKFFGIDNPDKDFEKIESNRSKCKECGR